MRVHIILKNSLTYNENDGSMEVKKVIQKTGERIGKNREKAEKKQRKSREVQHG